MARKIASLLILVFLTACSKTMLEDLPAIQPPAKKVENVDVALVLGGGGSRGIAHLGAIEVLEKNGIPIDLIVGTSAGSIVGALYADTPNYKYLKNKLVKLNKWDVLDFSLADSMQLLLAIKGPVTGTKLQQFVTQNIGPKNIEDLRTPFAAVATDLNSEKPYVFKSGPIATAVHASAAIPPIFTPVKAYGKELVDGGVVEPVPVRVAQEYKPKVIIAVDISLNGRDLNVYNMFDLTYKAMNVSYYALSQMQSQLADVRIHPNLEEYGMFDDHDNLTIYNIGKEEAEKMLPSILRELKTKGIALKNKTSSSLS